MRYGGVAATNADCDLLIVEPMAWMSGITDVRYGAIVCPKCKDEIGAFRCVLPRALPCARAC